MGADPAKIFVPPGANADGLKRAAQPEQPDQVRQHGLENDLPELTKDGVDVGLLRFTLSLTPAERLELLDCQLAMRSPLWVRGSRFAKSHRVVK